MRNLCGARLWHVLVTDYALVGCVVDSSGNEKLSNWRQESAKSINRINNMNRDVPCAVLSYGLRCSSSPCFTRAVCWLLLPGGEIKLMRNTYILYRLLFFECVSQNVPTLSRRRITLLFVPWWPPCCSSHCADVVTVQQSAMGTRRGTDAVPRTISRDFENTPAYCHIVKLGFSISPASHNTSNNCPGTSLQPTAFCYLLLQLISWFVDNEWMDREFYNTLYRRLNLY